MKIPFFDKRSKEDNVTQENRDIVGYLKALIGLSEVNKSVTTDLPDRPTDLGYSQMYSVGTATNKFTVPYGFQFTESLVYNSDVLRTVIRSVVWETFRNGSVIDNKFLFKCKRCGAEYSEPIDRCEVCKTDDFRRPFKMQKIRLEKWIKKANLNEQTFIDVMEDIDWNLNIFDNAYVIVRKEYFFNNEKRIIGIKPIEILSGDVKRISLLMNTDGRLGFDDENNMLFICPDHRYKLVRIPISKISDDKVIECPICGKECIHAIAEYGVANGVVAGTTNRAEERYYLGKGEILHVKKFSPGVGYGYPMPLSIATKVMLLMKMDHYALASYSMGRPPKGLLVLKANRESVAKAWQMLEEMSKRNPWMIAPLTIEGFDKYGSGKIAEWIDLSLKIDEPGLIQYRDELRRTIGACYGVMPLFHGDMSVGGGLNNEGLQITVTNRAVEQEQKIFNEQIFPWICKQLNISDFIVQLKPHEEKDMAAQLQREQMRLQIAQQLMQMGYNVNIKEGNDGIEFMLDDKDINSEFINILTLWAKKIVDTDISNVDRKELLEIIGKVLQNPTEAKMALESKPEDEVVGESTQELGVEEELENDNEEDLASEILDMIDTVFGGDEQKFENEPEGAGKKVHGKNKDVSGMPELDLD